MFRHWSTVRDDLDLVDVVCERLPISRVAELVRPSDPSEEIRSPQRRIPQPELMVNAKLTTPRKQEPRASHSADVPLVELLLTGLHK